MLSRAGRAKTAVKFFHGGWKVTLGTTILVEEKPKKWSKYQNGSVFSDINEWTKKKKRKTSCGYFLNTLLML